MAEGHHQHHHHSHAEGHLHSAGPGRHDRTFFVTVILNMAFVVIETVFGIFANSTALVADAGHNFSDVLALLVAWGAAVISRKAPVGRYTFGFRSTSILAALGNAMLLLVVCGAIMWESLHRLVAPPAVAGLTLMLVAGAGILINGASAWLFMRGSQEDLNIRGAYLHMLADTAVSLGVVVAGLAILYTGWYWLDPLISLVIVVVVIAGTWGLLREAVDLALHAIPSRIDVAAIENYLLGQPGVTEIHDLHIWGLSTTESALTVHLVMPGGYPEDLFLDDIAHALRERYAIHHCTLQVEQGTTGHMCVLVPRGLSAGGREAS